MNPPSLTVFSDRYATARQKFLQAALEAGVPVRSYREPAQGPDGEDLAADCVWLGPNSARRVVVLTSATHGVEGFCGSGAQIDFLRTQSPAAFPEGVAVLIVHACNPFGFAHLRRVTREGVDLNRNGVDFAGILPENPGYLTHRDLFRPQQPGSEAARVRAENLSELERAIGREAVAIARSSGQYIDPAGPHYGGNGPTWSRLTLESIMADFGLAAREQVSVIDFHTGLGPHGYGEPICGTKPDEPGTRRARTWYGESLTEPMLGSSTSVVIPGLVQYVWMRTVGPQSLTFIALEFGTYPHPIMGAAVANDMWLWNQDTIPPASAQWQQITASIRDAFYPDAPQWKEMVLYRSRQVIAQTLAGVAAH